MSKNDGDSQVITTFSIIKENKSNNVHQENMTEHHGNTFYRDFSPSIWNKNLKNHPELI